MPDNIDSICFWGISRFLLSSINFSWRSSSTNSYIFSPEPLQLLWRKESRFRETLFSCWCFEWLAFPCSSNFQWCWPSLHQFPKFSFLFLLKSSSIFVPLGGCSTWCVPLPFAKRFHKWPKALLAWWPSQRWLNINKLLLSMPGAHSSQPFCSACSKLSSSSLNLSISTSWRVCPEQNWLI